MFSCDFFEAVVVELDVLGAGAAAAGAAVEPVDFFSVDLLSVFALFASVLSADLLSVFELLASDFLLEPNHSFTPPWAAHAPRFDVADVKVPSLHSPVDP